jgi:hypothetical protein
VDRRSTLPDLAQEECIMRRYAAALVVAFVFVGSVQASDPTGTWKWSVGGGGGGQTREMTLKLKLEGDKLTGTMVRGDMETAIEDASFKDGTVSFAISIERQGQKRTTKYSGKLDGDTIKGKATSMRDGQEQARDWEAKRAK